MSIFLAIVAFIIIFSALVLIHEWGHFFVARRAGIKVEEFGFGLPPRVWGKKKGEVLYSLNAIPFGGFVRLLGEDSKDPKVLKDKRSFANKPAGVRIAVVVAGVVMNFLLAWGLLTIGFIFGIQPLIVNGEDFVKALDNGTVVLEYGKLNESAVVEEAGQSKMAVDEAGNPQQLLLPLITFTGIEEGSKAQQLGFLQGDALVRVSGRHVLFWEDILERRKGFEYIGMMGEILIDVLRDGEVQTLTVSTKEFFDLFELSPQGREGHGNGVVVTEVLPDGPAKKAGIQVGDVLVSIGEQPLSELEDVGALDLAGRSEPLEYTVRRDGEDMRMLVIPSEDGLIGVMLSSSMAILDGSVTLASLEYPATVAEVKEVQYPFWIAPGKALEESARLGVFTVQMLGGVLRSLVTQLSVPDGVAGPVGIAGMTHQFVQEGLLSLLRFTALLSLSLAIMNILPFPALDGGRLLFILVEVVTRKKVPPKFEAGVHAAGFLILILLILMVTWNDILRLL